MFLLVAGVLGVWIWAFRDVYLDPLELLPRDNSKYHFPLFLYITRSLELLGQFPRWMYSHQGGLWIETLANNFLILLPYRWVEYFLVSLFHWDALFTYKAGILFGEAVFLWGVYLVARELKWSVGLSACLVLGFFFSGPTLSFLHQEHALATLLFIPYMWLSLLRARETSWGHFFFSTLLGLSFNHHYPQLIMLYWLAVMLSCLASWSDFRRPFSLILSNFRAGGKSLALVSLLGFLISASPVIYSYLNFHDRLQSPFRHQKGGIATSSYVDYERINSAFSKVDPENFLVYFNFESASRSNISICLRRPGSATRSSRAGWAEFFRRECLWEPLWKLKLLLRGSEREF